MRTETNPREDALQFLMRSGGGGSSLGEQAGGERLLEVGAVWGDVVMDVRHYTVGGAPVTVGSTTGHRWRLLGAPVAWVPNSFAPLAWAILPTMSEVHEEWREEFFVRRHPADGPAELGGRRPGAALPQRLGGLRRRRRGAHRPR